MSQNDSNSPKVIDETQLREQIRKKLIEEESAKLRDEIRKDILNEVEFDSPAEPPHAGYEQRHTSFRRPPRHPRLSATMVIEKLFDIYENNDFSAAMFSYILKSTSLPKQGFIERICKDSELTAKFLKYFPGSKSFLNYSEINLIGHIMLFSLELPNCRSADMTRQKINAHDIWSIEKFGAGGMFDVLKQTVQKIPREEVESVKTAVVKWYDNLEDDKKYTE